ncbi:putative inorganic phosphate cotransporter [Sitophilus oryzae]|uniref:Putative inorganic phosphate cotransporter n=1 Tax=Sitophilus oryzae TaxID=7048 RepID=A0A6J2YE04_SITOR|nr:putative inorganic phosphate cotransporter [Sitophilus oryzae]
MKNSEDVERKEVLYTVITDGIEKTDSAVGRVGIRHYQAMLYFILLFVAFGFRVSLSVSIVAMTDPEASRNPDVPTYTNWTNKGVILSAFFWGYVLPQVMAGYVASRFGPKWFLVGTMGIHSILGLFLPLTAAKFGSTGLIINRALQGFCQGFFVPCLTYFLSQWIPKEERSRISMFCYGAIPSGTVVGIIASGVIAGSWYGWPMIFYLYGSLGLIWTVLYSFLAYNTPLEHPSISTEEKEYIRNSLGHSRSVVDIYIVFYNSLLSSLPYLSFWILGQTMSFVSDYIINKKIVSPGAARKIFSSIGLFVPSAALILLGYTKADQTIQAVCLLVASVGFLSVSNLGWALNHMDLSPNYAGLLMGLINALSNIFSIIAPLSAQILITDEKQFFLYLLLSFTKYTMSKVNVHSLKFVEYMEVGTNIQSEGKVPIVGVRHVQVLLSSFLVFTAFGFRIALSVAIVAMTDSTASKNPDIPTYQWNDKSVILSAFFWGYIIPQIFAGWAANTFGAKWILFGSIGTQSILGILIPVTSDKFGSKGLMASRALQGLSQGFLMPCLIHFLCQWVPVQERSRLFSVAMGGSMFGTVTSMYITGIISASWYGWPMVFYIYGVLGMFACILFAVFAYDSPAEHLSISQAEKFYIEGSLGHDDEKKSHCVPWKEIFTSVPLWALFITQCGYNYCFWTLLTQIPSYISHVMNFNIKDNSALSALPYLTFWILGFFFSYISDYLYNKKIFKVTTCRKLFNTSGMVLSAIALVFLGYTTPDQVTDAVALLITAVAASALCVCGWSVNHMDLSPNHAGTLVGITNGFSNIASIFAPLIVHLVVTNESDPTQWRTIFIIVASSNIITSLVFAIFGSGKVQPWNEDSDNK